MMVYLPDEINVAKEHIKQIHKRYEDAEPHILQGLTNSVRLLFQNFPSVGQFIIEFIQNADDAHSNEITFEATDSELIITNDGDPFSRENVESVCNSASSSKNPETNLGFLGIGFKSCFKISECPQILSGTYSFKFDKKTTSIEKPWELMPEWVEADNHTTKTVFKLPLIDDNQLKKIIVDYLSAEHLSGKVMLFLKNVKKISVLVNIGDKHFKREIEQITDNGNNRQYKVCSLMEKKNDDTSQEDWLVFRKEFIVPDEVKQDSLTKQFKRDAAKRREALVAFRIDKLGNLVPLDAGTLHFGVYSFLPLKETTSGLRFLIQGDFLTPPSRTDIIRESKWNEWMADSILNLITTECTPAMLENEKWRFAMGEILYVNYQSNSLIIERISKPLVNYLKTNKTVFDEDGALTTPSNVISVDAEVIDFIGREPLERLYGKKLLHRSTKLTEQLGINFGPDSLLEFISQAQGKTLLKEYVLKKDIDSFKLLYKELSNKLDEDSVLSNIELIPTDAWELVTVSSARILNDISVSREALIEYRLVNTKLTEDYEIYDILLKRFNIKPLTSTEINVALERKTLSMTENEWASLPEDKKFNVIKTWCDAFSLGKIQPETISYITLPSKEGSWMKPSELFIPSDFNPEQDLEKLVSEGFIRDEQLKIHFVSSTLLSNKDDSERRKWSNFLKHLCEKDTQITKKITECIAVNTVLKYEKEKGRSARELTQSEKGNGYDILSIDAVGGKRLIESKGFKEYKADFFMPYSEYAKMREVTEKNSAKEKYYVYVVKNCWTTPYIHVVPGDGIISLNLDVTVKETGYKGWKRKVDDFKIYNSTKL